MSTDTAKRPVVVVVLDNESDQDVPASKGIRVEGPLDIEAYLALDECDLDPDRLERDGVSHLKHTADMGIMHALCLSAAQHGYEWTKPKMQAFALLLTQDGYCHLHSVAKMCKEDWEILRGIKGMRAMVTELQCAVEGLVSCGATTTTVPVGPVQDTLKATQPRMQTTLTPAQSTHAHERPQSIYVAPMAQNSDSARVSRFEATNVHVGNLQSNMQGDGRPAENIEGTVGRKRKRKRVRPGSEYPWYAPENYAYYCPHDGCQYGTTSKQTMILHLGCKHSKPLPVPKPTPQTGNIPITVRRRPRHSAEVNTVDAFTETNTVSRHGRPLKKRRSYREEESEVEHGGETPPGYESEAMHCLHPDCAFSTHYRFNLQRHADNIHRDQDKVPLPWEQGCQATHKNSGTFPDPGVPVGRMTATYQTKDRTDEDFEEGRCVCPHAGCNATFASWYHLSRHMASVHSDSRPYKCDYPGCEATFKREDHMRKHVCAHTRSGEWPVFSDPEVI